MAHGDPARPRRSQIMALGAVDAAHLLRRTGFGASAADVDRLAGAVDRADAVERILATFDDVEDAPLPIGTGPSSNLYGDWMALTTWWLERMRTTSAPLVERMVLFWHGHFVSGLNKVFDIGLLAQQHDTLRRHALGDYRTLLGAVAFDPAMLLYLDNAFNFRTHPQENFARELLELFTTGPGHYDQDDVVALARAWTGHSVDDTWRRYANRDFWHDAGDKELFGTTRNWDGPETLDALLFGPRAEATSRFLGAKLWSTFAYPVGAEDPEVDDVAAAARATAFDLRAVLRAILTSEAFWSDAGRAPRTRPPAVWIVAVLRATGLSATETGAAWFLERCGQGLFNAADVSGWRDQDAWTATSTTWARTTFANQVRWRCWIDERFADQEVLATDEVLDSLRARFGVTEWSASTERAMRDFVDGARARGVGWEVAYNLPMIAALAPEVLAA